MDFKTANQITNFLDYHSFEIRKIKTRYETYDYPDEFLRSPATAQPNPDSGVTVTTYILTDGAGKIILKSQNKQELINQIQDYVAKDKIPRKS